MAIFRPLTDPSLQHLIRCEARALQTLSKRTGGNWLSRGWLEVETGNCYYFNTARRACPNYRSGSRL